MAKKKEAKLTITLVRSPIGYPQTAKSHFESLGA